MYPGLQIFVGGVDAELTEAGMILPGLGDSGGIRQHLDFPDPLEPDTSVPPDRLFATLG